MLTVMASSDEALARAIARGDVAGARDALAGSAKPDGMDEAGTPFLQFALDVGQEEVVRVLLEAGADPNLVTDRPPLAAVLLDLGVPVNQANRHGWTPLHPAAAYDYQGSVRLLLDHGADVTARTQQGLTPADIAANNGLYYLADMLRSTTPTQPDQAPG